MTKNQFARAMKLFDEQCHNSNARAVVVRAFESFTEPDKKPEKEKNTDTTDTTTKQE